MDFDLSHARPILERTPVVLRALLSGLPSPWVMTNEGKDGWSPYDVVGHLLQGEATDWMTRVDLIMAKGDAETFKPFDRTAMMENSKGKSLEQLLDAFETARADSLRRLDAYKLTAADLSRVGKHPAFGRVTLGQLLATWVAHDLGHLVQVARTMGGQYREAVGPWTEYLSNIQPPPARAS